MDRFGCLEELFLGLIILLLGLAAGFAWGESSFREKCRAAGAGDWKATAEEIRWEFGCDDR